MKNTANSISGIPQDLNKLLVSKSRPLMSLYQSDLTLQEFKILDAYLARIDPHKPNLRTVQFKKGELENLLEVTKINLPELSERLKNLMRNVVRIEDGTTKKGFRLVTLFEECHAEQDDDGLWIINLECTSKAMRYFFETEALGYFRYKLRSVTKMQSRYTYLLFCYLESNRFRMHWDVELSDLKKILKCDNVNTYANFKDFNRLILKMAHAEIIEKTECRYSYTPVRRGRSVSSIHFELEHLSAEIFPESQVSQPSIFDLNSDSANEKKDHRNEICFGFSQPEFDSFTDEQLQFLKSIAWDKKNPASVERFKEVFDSKDAYEMATSEYLEQKIRLAKIHNPKNLFSYVKKIIEKD